MFITKSNDQRKGTELERVTDIFGKSRFQRGEVTWFTKDTAMRLMSSDMAIMYRPYMRKLVSSYPEFSIFLTFH